MRLEAVDRKNPTLICVATIADINLSREDSLLIHFDGWGSEYAYLMHVEATCSFLLLLSVTIIGPIPTRQTYTLLDSATAQAHPSHFKSRAIM